MENVINNLRPIERLYLISKEKEEVFDKKNRLYCLIYYLIENKNLKVSNNSNKFKINGNGTNYNKQYEDQFMNFIKEKKFLDLNKFIENLVFNKTLIENNVLNLEVKAKKFLFIKLAKENLSKTALYYELQGHYSKELEKGINVLNIVCENPKTKDQIMNFYNLLKERMKQAVIEAEKRKKEESKFENPFGISKNEA